MARRNTAGSGSIAALVVALLAVMLALAVYLVWAGGGMRRQAVALNLPGPGASLPSPDRLPNPQPLPAPLPRKAG